jgi:hypothetical protein
MKQAKFIEVSADVRYWEDATVNGQEDADGSLIPCRVGDSWQPVIDLESGLILNWPSGNTANIHYKVCDAGEYWLLDSVFQRIGKWAGFYVPNEFLCHGDNGHGDYIILIVGQDGKVQNWRKPEVQWTCTCQDDNNEQVWKHLSTLPISRVDLDTL